MRKLAVITLTVLGLFVALADGWPAAAGDKIRLGSFRTNISPPALLAMDVGAFAKEGIEVEIVTFDNSAGAAMSVVAGDVDIASMFFSAAAFNLAGKGGLKLIGGTVREEPGYDFTAFVVTPKAYAAGMRTPRDFAGKTIGITTVGSPAHYTLAELARKYGFDLASVHMLQMQSMPATAAALGSGKIDGSLVLASLANKAVHDGVGRIIGWVGDEVPQQAGGLFTSPKAIAALRDVIERFLRAYKVGAGLYYDTFLRRDASGRPVRGPNYDHFVDVLAKGQSVTRGVVEAMFAYNDPEIRLDVRSVFDQVRFWQSLGMVDANVDPRSVVDLSFIHNHLNVPSN